MRDEDIDTSDIAPLDEDFFVMATLRLPSIETPVAVVHVDG
jgi:hypothetical protein